MTDPIPLDVLASYARTALDDPGLMVDEQKRVVAGAGYAIDRLDDLINAINPAELTNENAAGALTILGRHMAEVARRLEIETGDLIPARREEAITAIGAGLDSIDEAIAALKDDDE